MKVLLVLICLTLVSCATVPLEPDEPATRALVADSTLPPMKTFQAPRPQAPRLSNGTIAADFLDLHFMLESGRDLPVLTRFEGPITVAVTGAPPPTLAADLARLLNRLRGEAGIDIRQIGAGEGVPNIVIEAVSRTEIRQALPQAACFVVPNVTSLRDFMRYRRSERTNWARLTRRETMAIFVPHDASPQEVRDCLHEELAQALGPLNDLYRLRDSVFNDDNVHTVLTGFDMLILRATYSPALRSGMSRTEVAARLPRILSTLNPAGDGIPGRPQIGTPRAWIDAIQTALGPGSSTAQREAAIARALQVAAEARLDDHRRAFGHYIAGRMIQNQDPDLAQRHYATAQSYYDRTPGTELHQAYLSAQIAAHAISRGDGRAALARIGPAMAAARDAENAGLLATLMLLQAEAFTLTGNLEAARAVRLDSLGWARYGFGPDWAVRAKMREIAALNPARF